MNSIDVKELRKRLGITQKDLAQKLDVEPVTISRWERQERKPHPVHLRKLERLERRRSK